MVAMTALALQDPASIAIRPTDYAVSGGEDFGSVCQAISFVAALQGSTVDSHFW